MGNSVSERLLGAIALLIKPLVKLLISQGVSFPKLVDTAREVYVETAIRHFGIDGKLIRPSIAVLTGMKLDEVDRVIDQTLSTEPTTKSVSRPERVMTAWYGDPRYTGPYGVPLDLPFEGQNSSDVSVTSLIRTHSGDADIPIREVLDDLISAGCVVESHSRYRAVRRMYAPEPLSSEMIDRLGNVGYWVFSTIINNVQGDPVTGHTCFERAVFADDGCTDEVILEFDNFIKKRAPSLIDEIDGWFTASAPRMEDAQQRKDTGFYMVHYIDDGHDRSSLRDLLIERGEKPKY